MPAPARAKETPIETLSLEERIRRRAYELYVQRGSQSGSELDDWLQAEEELRRANGLSALTKMCDFGTFWSPQLWWANHDSFQVSTLNAAATTQVRRQSFPRSTTRIL
jgi:Protein of unknown function (DUF2934)